MNFRILGFVACLGIVLSTSSARADDDAWKDAAMTALFANAEAVLQAKQMVEGGRPIFGMIEHRIVSETDGPESLSDRPSLYPVRVEEFAFEVDASFGDAIQKIGKLTITQTTTRYPRSPTVEYRTKVERCPTGIGPRR